MRVRYFLFFFSFFFFSFTLTWLLLYNPRSLTRTTWSVLIINCDSDKTSLITPTSILIINKKTFTLNISLGVWSNERSRGVEKMIWAQCILMLAGREITDRAQPGLQITNWLRCLRKARTQYLRLRPLIRARVCSASSLTPPPPPPPQSDNNNTTSYNNQPGASRSDVTSPSPSAHNYPQMEITFKASTH